MGDYEHRRLRHIFMCHMYFLVVIISPWASSKGQTHVRAWLTMSTGGHLPYPPACTQSGGLTHERLPLPHAAPPESISRAGTQTLTPPLPTAYAGIPSLQQHWPGRSLKAWQEDRP